MAGSFRVDCLYLLAALCLLVPQLAHSQETETSVVVETPVLTNTLAATDSKVEKNLPAGAEILVPRRTPGKHPVESEIAATSMVSYGDYRVFGATARCNVWTSGVEYDRHSWGYFLKAQIDYVVEVLPFVLLSEPAKADFWGNPKSPDQQLIHGVGISPFGFRFLWRSNQVVKPYMTGKIGVVAFNKKALSPNSTYANFNVQGDFGVQIRLTDRVELRIVPLEYFHVSNGYLAASNPGMDELAGKFGLSYHLGKHGE